MDNMNQNSKSNKGLLWGLLGCLGGIIIVILAIIIVALLFFKGVDEELNGTKDEQTQRKETENKTFKIGDTITGDNVSYKLESVEYANTSGEMVTPPNNGTALKVNLSFKNENEEQVLVSNDDFSIKVNGQNYEEWSGTDDSNGMFSHQLNTGNTAKGYIYYDVPEADQYTLELSTMPFFNDIKGKWQIKKSDIQSSTNNTSAPSTSNTDESTTETAPEQTEEDNTESTVTRSNVIDFVEDYEGQTLDTDTYTFKEPEQRSDNTWGFAFYTKDGELAGSYIVDQDGIVTKFDEDGVEE